MLNLLSRLDLNNFNRFFFRREFCSRLSTLLCNHFGNLIRSYNRPNLQISNEIKFMIKKIIKNVLCLNQKIYEIVIILCLHD